jgi:hypothetical protein
VDWACEINRDFAASDRQGHFPPAPEGDNRYERLHQPIPRDRRITVISTDIGSRSKCRDEWDNPDVPEETIRE